MNDLSSLPDAKAPALPRSETVVPQSPLDEAIHTPLPETPAASTKPLVDAASQDDLLPAAPGDAQQDPSSASVGLFARRSP